MCNMVGNIGLGGLEPHQYSEGAGVTSGGWGTLNFFSGSGVRFGIPKWRACERIIFSPKEGPGL